MLMKQAKIVEVEEAKKGFNELLSRLSDHLQKSYKTKCHVIQTRHKQFAKKKLNFLAKRACTMSVN